MIQGEDGGCELDVLLRWQDAALPEHDGSLGDDRFDQVDADEAVAAPLLEARGSGAPPPPDECFVWTHERDRALEEALRELGRQPRPAVVVQLEEVREALLLGTLPPAGAATLLGELVGYLEGQLEQRKRIPRSFASDLAEAGSAVEHALLLLRDAVVQLMAYAANGETSAVVLTQRLTEQALHHLDHARHTLMASPLAGSPELEARHPGVP